MCACPPIDFRRDVFNGVEAVCDQQEVRGRCPKRADYFCEKEQAAGKKKKSKTGQSLSEDFSAVPCPLPVSQPGANVLLPVSLVCCVQPRRGPHEVGGKKGSIKKEIKRRRHTSILTKSVLATSAFPGKDFWEGLRVVSRRGSSGVQCHSIGNINGIRVVASREVISEFSRARLEAKATREKGR